MSDLVETLVGAAAAAIANERPALESPVGHVRGITVELLLTGAVQVHEAVCYVESRTAAGALLARHAGKGSAA